MAQPKSRRVYCRYCLRLYKGCCPYEVGRSVHAANIHTTCEKYVDLRKPLACDVFTRRGRGTQNAKQA